MKNPFNAILSWVLLCLALPLAVGAATVQLPGNDLTLAVPAVSAPPAPSSLSADLVSPLPEPADSAYFLSGLEALSYDAESLPLYPENAVLATMPEPTGASLVCAALCVLAIRRRK